MKNEMHSPQRHGDTEETLEKTFNRRCIPVSAFEVLCVSVSRWFKRFFFLLSLLLLNQAWAALTEVAGVRLDDKARVGNADLVLNGAGIRKKFIFKVYVGALYAAQATHDAAAVINATTPRRMHLRLLRDTDADTLLNALRDGLKANLSAVDYAAQAVPLGKLEALFKAVGQVKEGDVLTMDFSPEGVSVAMNGAAKGHIEGEAFGRSLLRVWLGDQPVDADLKKGLLGQ